MGNYVGKKRKKTNQGKSSRSKHTTKNRAKLRKKLNRGQG